MSPKRLIQRHAIQMITLTQILNIVLSEATISTMLQFHWKFHRFVSGFLDTALFQVVKMGSDQFSMIL